jgi:hypothetical protein
VFHEASVPLMLVDDRGRVLQANEKAVELLAVPGPAVPSCGRRPGGARPCCR